MSKKLLSLSLATLVGLSAIGCNSGEPTAATPPAADGTTPAGGKAGEMKGMSTDGLKATTAGANADKIIGSKAGGN